MTTSVTNITKFILIALTIISIAACDNSAKTTAVKTDSVTAVKPAAIKPDSGKLIGAWHDEAIKSDKGEEIAYEVISSGHKVYIQAITFTGTNLTLNDTPPITPASSEIRKEGDKYICVERPDESYKIDKDGNLLLYDKGVLVATCKKLL
jgi:hypothetical protein